MDNNAVETTTEVSTAHTSSAVSEDGFVRSLATIHKNLKNRRILKSP